MRANPAAHARLTAAMVDATTDVEHSVNLVFLAVTAAIAWHGIRYRDADGNPDTVRLLFGCIAATFFFLVLFQDVLGLVRF